MAPLSAKIRPRLGQLVRMLSSTADGEVLAAARAIGRTLAGEGKSFHDLAEAVEVEPQPVFSSSRYPVYDVWEPPEPVHKGPPAWQDLREFERNDWLTAFVRKLDITDKDEMAALVRFRSECLSPVGAQCPTRKQIQLFTRLMERAWKVGVKP